jgi:hypothetical protein
MQTTDGHELKKNNYYYLENGQCVVLNEFATTADGRDVFMVTPFYEGEAISANGDSGYHSEITVPYEHEGEEILVAALFEKAPTAKLCSHYAAKVKEIELLSLAIGELKLRVQDMNKDKNAANLFRKDAIKQCETEKKILESLYSDHEKINDDISKGRQKLSELEDSIAGIAISQADGMTTTSIRDLQELRKREFKLTCLENGGVDNWEWYGESLKDYRDRYPG